MKIALVQLDYHIGNFKENTTKIFREIENANKKNVDLIVFSELALCGYPPMDLLESKEFIRKCQEEIKQIAEKCIDIAVIIGGPSLNQNKEGKLLFNSAFFLNNGMVEKVFHKSRLPSYDLFDENRYFEPNREFSILKYKDKNIAITICEDIWDKQSLGNEFTGRRLNALDPMKESGLKKSDLLINISASPFSHNYISIKKEMLVNTALKYKIPLIYVNQAGGQAQQIFDGGSMAVNRNGQIVEQLNYFTEDRKIIDTAHIDIDPGEGTILKTPDRISMIHDALVTGIKDYFHKLKLKKAVLGLSGGLDSAVVLVLAYKALGKKNVHSLLLPSQFSSDHSVSDSTELSENLGTSYDLIDIRKAYYTILDLLKPVFKDLPENITEENIQARIRGLLLMAYSNKHGHILLNTSNKSEAAVGYGTLYGDMAGALSVLGDVYKTDIYKLAAYINRNEIIIPENIINKVPSAELRPNQKDTDSLPEYSLLDRVLYEYIELQKSKSELLEAGFDKDVIDKIINLVNSSEFKRYQSPPLLRISSKAFGENRRIPLTASF